MKRFYETESSESESDTCKRPRISPSVPRRNALPKHLPESILWLSPIAQRIDEFIMEQDEAELHAAKTGQVPWLKQLVLRSGVDIHDMAIAAVGSGQVQAVEFLLICDGK